MAAFKAGNRDYVLSTAELLHEEFMYTVSESTELTGDTLRRASKLHALYCVSLGLIKLMSNEPVNDNPTDLLRNAVSDGDLSSLTLSLTTAAALLIKGFTSWINEFSETTQGIDNGFIKEIVSSFLEIARLISIVNP
ncbi:hypothetical protein [Vulcanisaeta distributa]|uniref:hypothetical protein n=1 Tax=Vulcanisaeta distributa TaxID=164451 RepID=UPI000A40728B|nr:hypothetical protein [Vulcanisaeta distributa]